jgi:hypothetical protein
MTQLGVGGSDDGHSSQQSRAKEVTQPLSAAITTMMWVSIDGFSGRLVTSGLWKGEKVIFAQAAGATSRQATMPANSGAGAG